MSTWTLAAIAPAVLLLCCAQPDAGTYTIPRGSTISVKTMDEISTKVHRLGDPFEARLSSPIGRGSTILIPLGTRVNGVVGALRPSHGEIHLAQVDLRLTRLYLPDQSYLELRTVPLLREASPKMEEAVVIPKDTLLIFTLELGVAIPQSP